MVLIPAIFKLKNNNDRKIFYDFLQTIHYPMVVANNENPIMYINAYQPQKINQKPGKQEMSKH